MLHRKKGRVRIVLDEKTKPPGTPRALPTERHSRSTSQRRENDSLIHVAGRGLTSRNHAISYFCAPGSAALDRHGRFLMVRGGRTRPSMPRLIMHASGLKKNWNGSAQRCHNTRARARFSPQALEQSMRGAQCSSASSQGRRGTKENTWHVHERCTAEQSSGEPLTLGIKFQNQCHEGEASCSEMCD